MPIERGEDVPVSEGLGPAARFRRDVLSRVDAVAVARPRRELPGTSRTELEVQPDSREGSVQVVVLVIERTVYAETVLEGRIDVE